MSVDYGPRDLCPLGHGPMWWWPTGGEWACQLPTCEVTVPVYAHEVREFIAAFDRLPWVYRLYDAYQVVTPPRSIFNVTSIS